MILMFFYGAIILDIDYKCQISQTLKNEVVSLLKISHIVCYQIICMIHKVIF